MTDYTISILDQDAIDAINSIIATNGLGEKPESVIAGMIVPQLVAMRGQQLLTAAQAKALQDPALVVFQTAQAAKQVAAKAAQITPPTKAPSI